jgi:hypothetical protein
MATLEEQLAALTMMSAAQLREEWQRVCQSELPRFGPDLLRRAIAYRLQARRHGDLPTARARELQRIANGARNILTPRLKPGTRLLRSWHGRTVAVLVTEEGYLFEDRPYTSLSKIAREVTGTAWSGPRFFGLRAMTKDRARG